MGVRYDRFEDRYRDLMQAEYEKCNIWPKAESAAFGLQVLYKEVQEVSNAAFRLSENVSGHMDGVDPIIPDMFELGEIKAQAIEIILETLQVLSVCNKYEDVFAGAVNKYFDSDED